MSRFVPHQRYASISMSRYTARSDMAEVEEGDPYAVGRLSGHLGILYLYRMGQIPLWDLPTMADIAADGSMVACIGYRGVETKDHRIIDSLTMMRDAPIRDRKNRLIGLVTSIHYEPLIDLDGDRIIAHGFLS